MSTISVSNIQDAGGGGSIDVQGEGNATTNLQQGLAKQWCYQEGVGTPSLSDSFNVASLEDLATGVTKQNCTNNFANTDFSVTAMATDQNEFIVLIEYTSTTPRTTSSAMTAAANTGGTNVDCDGRSITIHGDLA
tara:strand:+ start:651 stop:1055 length:405 start_codon:yes stop_codon:yes gene_type:complete